MRYEKSSPSIIRWNHQFPSHWSCEKAKRFFANPKRLNKENGERTILSLTLRGVIRNDGDKPIGLSPSDYSTYQIFYPGELVFKLIDLNNISTSRVGLVPEKGIMSSAYIRFAPREDMNIKYFYYQYFDWYKRNIFNGLGEGVRQTLSGTDLMNLEILVPPRAEQDQIVRYLDWQVSKINKLIAAKKKQKTLLLDYKRSIINSSMKLSNCQRRLLKTLVKEISISDSPNGDFYLGMENVESWTARYIPTKSVIDGNGKRFKKGDLLFGKLRPYLAKIYMPAQNGVCSGEFLVLRGYEGYLPFLKYCLLSNDFIQLVNSSTYGAKMPRTSWNFIGCCSIPHPPYSEQIKLVKSIDNHCVTIDNSIENIDKEISLSHELRTRLISDVVTGQIDVRSIEVPDFEMVVDIDIDDTLNEDKIPEEAEEQEE